MSKVKKVLAVKSKFSLPKREMKLAVVIRKEVKRIRFLVLLLIIQKNQNIFL